MGCNRKISEFHPLRLEFQKGLQGGDREKVTCYSGQRQAKKFQIKSWHFWLNSDSKIKCHIAVKSKNWPEMCKFNRLFPLVSVKDKLFFIVKVYILVH